MARFYFLTGDVDPKEGACYVRKIEMGRYHVVELHPWDCEDTYHTYYVGLTEVDVLATPESTMRNAAASAGWDTAEVARQQKGLKYPDLVWVELLHRCGNRAPLFEDSGNNYQKLLKCARDESHRLDDPVAYNRAMSTPKTRVGSTARELMQGDSWTALYPGRLDFKTPQGIEVTKPEPFPGPVVPTVALSFTPDKLESTDPTAYATGFLYALAGNGLSDGAHRGELTPEYISGYRAGVEAKCTRPKLKPIGWRPERVTSPV